MHVVSEISQGEIITALEEELKKGVLQENGKYKLEEKLIGNIKGLKILIFFDEHPPPHFRVVDGNGEANDYTIDECVPLHGKTLSKYLRNIKKWHGNHKEYLIQTWNRTRPTNCSVGIIRNKSV